MEVAEQDLEQSKHVLTIPPGEKKQEFPRFTPSGQVTIAKRPVCVAPQQKKKEVKKLEVQVEGALKGAKAAEGKKPEVKKLEVKKPTEKKPETKTQAKWAEKAAAPAPKSPEQQQQQQ